MRWNDHSKDIPEGSHAFLGASKYSWLNYNDEKLIEVYKNHRATERGTELHELACKLIRMGIKLPSNHKTLNMYVNDAIGYKMDTEIPLKYSPRCFGTADAITFKRNVLRIHDYKSGKTPASFHQLEIYAALFFLEYKEYKVEEVSKIELRIYQNDEVRIDNPEGGDIIAIMNKIIHSDNILKEYEENIHV